MNRRELMRAAPSGLLAGLLAGGAANVVLAEPLDTSPAGDTAMMALFDKWREAFWRFDSANEARCVAGEAYEYQSPELQEIEAEMQATKVTTVGDLAALVLAKARFGTVLPDLRPRTSLGFTLVQLVGEEYL